MNGNVGFAIIGGGLIARFHAEAIATAEHARLIGVYDINHAAAEAIASEYHGKAYDSLEELLNDSDVQAVTIATPSGFHGDSVMAAARAHKHVLCEKPLEVTREKIRAMIRTCTEKHVLLAPVFQTRFTPQIQQLYHAMQTGRFGKMLFASARVHWYRDDAYYAKSSWHGTWNVDGGGALINQAIHTVDQLLYINGLPESVTAYAGALTHFIEVEDTLCAAIRFQNGSFGTIEASTSCAPGFPRRLEFTGTTGSVVLEEDQFRRWEFAQKDEMDVAIRADMTEKAANAKGGSSPSNIDCAGHAIQIENLAMAILTGCPLKITAQDGANTMEFIFGIYESVRTGRPFSFTGFQA